MEWRKSSHAVRCHCSLQRTSAQGIVLWLPFIYSACTQATISSRFLFLHLTNSVVQVKVTALIAMYDKLTITYRWTDFVFVCLFLFYSKKINMENSNMRSNPFIKLLYLFYYWVRCGTISRSSKQWRVTKIFHTIQINQYQVYSRGYILYYQLKIK